jgi:protein-S-isoprenylcysteine O-methyltransferase Ste14
VDLYKKWASREYSLTRRLLALIPAFFLFVLIFPYLLVILLPRLDELLHLPRLFIGAVNYIFGIPLIVLGVIYGFWSIYSQLTRASGTPLPMMPTQKLLIDGPFKQCRNPMTFGTITAYLGVGILIGSVSSIVFVLIIGALLLTYLKKFEERELEIRFGQEYVAYKKNTPMFLPRIRFRKD